MRIAYAFFKGRSYVHADGKHRNECWKGSNHLSAVMIAAVFGSVVVTLGDQFMSESEADTARSDQNPTAKQLEPRAPRSIRFSYSEWEGIIRTARAREMTTAELVRHAAVSLATDILDPISERFPPEIAAQIQRIYRGVSLLATLKRDEMAHERQQEELERIAKAASESQASVRKESVTPPKPAV